MIAPAYEPRPPMSDDDEGRHDRARGHRRIDGPERTGKHAREAGKQAADAENAAQRRSED